MMRYALLALFVLLAFFTLLGCRSNGYSREYNISFSAPEEAHEFSESHNKTLDVLSFTIRNNEDFALDCFILFEMTNTTRSVDKNTSVGLLEPGSQKRIDLRIEMFYGDSDMTIYPLCRKV